MSLGLTPGISIESLGLTGKLFSDDLPKKSKQTPKKDELDDFCAFMGIESALCSTKSPVDTQSRDLLKIDVEKELLKTGNQEILQRHSRSQKKKLNKEMREKQKGKEWFNLPATEVTDEIKNDLKVLQMRSVLDPKHFYKKNDLKVLPKYFQVGQYLDSPLDYHQEKHVKKSKKRSIVDDLLKDAEFQKRIKRKYKEIAAKEKPFYRNKKSGESKKFRKEKKKKK
ncbi:deoxynucleotidyltransferase terminal-interacting protein 2 [Phlebotomus papatasi]|uniref:deoxynucleotidyltransferase terminal-interacting protein 2 n=1 Tax=Phlebotomus papatasi TaxID=29031 RepID=UPI002483C567|nr:deoxynucleotidyltransferase terminal-interacting protein 2 [Phlebotomus papatasi]